MVQNSSNQTTKIKTFPAQVVSIIDPYKVVINRGSIHGLKEGQRMLIYALSDHELRDPKTNESLGYLELVRGKGKIVNLQEELSTVESDERRLTKKANLGEFIPTLDDEIKPFDSPQPKDWVKPI